MGQHVGNTSRVLLEVHGKYLDADRKAEGGSWLSYVGLDAAPETSREPMGTSRTRQHLQAGSSVGSGPRTAYPQLHLIPGIRLGVVDVLAFYVSATLGVAGLTFAVLAFVSDRPVERRHRVLLGALSGTSVLVAVSIAAGLRFAQPTVCRMLGGEWLAHRGHICWNEWGGNGINDPGGGSVAVRQPTRLLLGLSVATRSEHVLARIRSMPRLAAPTDGLMRCVDRSGLGCGATRPTRPSVQETTRCRVTVRPDWCQ